MQVDNTQEQRIDREEIILTVCFLAIILSFVSFPVLIILAFIFGGWLIYALLICLIVFGVAALLILIIE